MARQKIPIWFVMENSVVIKRKARCTICYNSGEGIVDMKNEKEIKKHFIEHLDILFVQEL